MGSESGSVARVGWLAGADTQSGWLWSLPRRQKMWHHLPRARRGDAEVTDSKETLRPGVSRTLTAFDATIRF